MCGFFAFFSPFGGYVLPCRHMLNKMSPKVVVVICLPFICILVYFFFFFCLLSTRNQRQLKSTRIFLLVPLRNKIEYKEPKSKKKIVSINKRRCCFIRLMVDYNFCVVNTFFCSYLNFKSFYL